MIRDLSLLEPEAESGVTHLFRPYITQQMRDSVSEQLQTRWIGQGPRVEEFERLFEEKVLGGESHAVAVSSCTAGLHLAYKMALESSGAPATQECEVACPVFTCTATNLP